MLTPSLLGHAFLLLYLPGLGSPLFSMLIHSLLSLVNFKMDQICSHYRWNSKLMTYPIFCSLTQAAMPITHAPQR